MCNQSVAVHDTGSPPDVQLIGCDKLDVMDDVTINRDVELDVSAAELWQLVTDSEQLGDWLGDSVAIELRPGGVGTVVDGGIWRDVRVDHVDHGRRIEFTWAVRDEPATASRVVIEVESLPGGGSRLGITETLSASVNPPAADAARLAWEVRVCCLWACTVAAALVQ